MTLGGSTNQIWNSYTLNITADLVQSFLMKLKSLNLMPIFPQIHWIQLYVQEVHRQSSIHFNGFERSYHSGSYESNTFT